MKKSAVKKFPVLYKTASDGKEQQWEIKVVPVYSVGDVAAGTEQPVAEIVTTHGQVGGKMQTATVRVEKGKNLNKANATTAWQQGQLEAEAKWKKQLDKGYSESRGGASMDLKPMLAQKYEDRKDKVDFANAFVQPKLDGVRALAIRKGDNISLLSRQGKEHVGLAHIRTSLLAVMPDGAIWDGELYHHDIEFQKIISLVKKEQTESARVQYHVYDSVGDEGFELRNHAVATALDPEGTESSGTKPNPCLVLVPTLRVRSHDEVFAAHAEHVAAGYEGAMLRWGTNGYKSGYRSEHLLKIKSWTDGEFEIVDVVPGVGKEADKGTFVCKTAQGTLFNCRPEGSDSVRAEYLANKANYISKQLKVKYFDLTTSEAPVPRFPVGLAVRDECEGAANE